MEPEIKNLGKVSATVEGEHRLNRDYKRLSIVNITQNNGTASYISKRYVPKNTSILDTYYWMPLVTPASGGGSSTIEGLTDVYINNLINGQILVYNSLLDKWVNGSNAANSYICTFTHTTDSQTDTEVYSCDKTISEIIAAANEGKTVIAKISESSEETGTTVFIPLNLILNGIVIFGGLTATPYGNGLMILYGVHNSSTDSDEWNNESSVLGTAAALDVAASGNASSTQVVKGDDTRLTDPRPASDVSAWAKEASKPTYTASEVGAIPTTEKDSANGVATLNSNGKIPSHQLPSYVDDVLEYNSYSDLPAIGERGKIYVTLDTNKTYRWGGSAYAEISESLALGETSSTAYPGDKGKANADYIAAIKDGTSIDSFGDVETALADKINKVSNPTNGNFAALDSNGKVVDSGHKHSDYLTSQENADWNATSGSAKILNKPTIPASVSGTNDGTNWTSLTIGNVTKNIPSVSGGLTNYDFTPNTKITHSSSSTTESITFAANTQGTQWIDTSVDLDISIACNNDASNYILVNNTGSSDIAVTITGVTHNGTSVTVKLANVDNGEVSVGAGKCREFGILRYSDGYIITNVEL